MSQSVRIARRAFFPSQLECRHRAWPVQGLEAPKAAPPFVLPCDWQHWAHFLVLGPAQGSEPIKTTPPLCFLASQHGGHFLVLGAASKLCAVLLTYPYQVGPWCTSSMRTEAGTRPASVQIPLCHYLLSLCPLYVRYLYLCLHVHHVVLFV